MSAADGKIGSMSVAGKDEDMVYPEIPLVPSVITPFFGPKLMDLPMFQGEQKEDLYWGTYHPQAYFGLSARDRKPLVAGLMWLVMRDGKPMMRHFCEDKEDLESFGWKEHNGIDFGRQVIIEKEMKLETSFVKSKDGSHGYGGDWSVRINVENKEGPLDEQKLGAQLFFYIIDEDRNELNLGLKDSTTLVSGSRVENLDVGNWQLHLKLQTPGFKIHYCGLKTPNSVDLSDLVLKNLAESKSGLELSDTAEDSSNVYVFQITCTTAPTSSIDIAFVSGLKEETAEMEKRVDVLTGFQLSSLLEDKSLAFDEQFKKCYNFSEKVDSDKLMVAKAAIANMLGGIGYFYGQSKISYKNDDGFLMYWQAGLYTAVPCRSKFPWGFLWDEGFHQMLIWRWDLRITLEIVGHWFDLMNMEGWIPREQILGAEALSKISPEYVTQDPDIANPPTLLLVLCDLINGIQTKKFNKDETKHITIFLEQAFPRLEAWFRWLYTSQRGKKEGSFYWRGRDSTTDQELNPRTLASGMDDYPRASHPSEDERHVDLRCWIYIAADCMKFISEFVTKKDPEMGIYSLIANELSNFKFLNKMHYDYDLETYLDYGNHTEKVRLVCESGKLVRVTDEEPELRLVPHIGYNSFFPFISKIIPSNSQILEEQLELISNDSIVWSDYGLLSLSKTSSFYMKWNSLHQKPYWRGPIWLNMNYLILSSLYHYSKVIDGPYSSQAGVIYDNLRNNLISNVVENYDKTGYIWEQYDQTKGTGEGGRDFTGWSSLILLIISEKYPRL